MANDPVVYVVDLNGTLATIDLISGAITNIGKADIPLISIAFSPTGQLYGTDGKALYLVNLVNGSLYRVGNFGASISVSSIRFSGDGNLFADSSASPSVQLPDGMTLPPGYVNRTLYTINSQTAAATIIYSQTYPSTLPLWVGDLSFADGHLYEISNTGRPGPTTATVNPTNGVSVPSNLFSSIGEVFLGPNNATYNLSYGAVQAINLANGMLTQVTTYDASKLGSIVTAASPLDAAPQGNYYIVDGTTGTYSYANGSNYNGTAFGPTSEFVTNTSDVLNVTALVPSTFIEIGYIPGQQTAPTEGGINVSYANGNNVLDGYAGSNFLTGGTGSDTFYIDDRTLAQNSWSTVVHFHAGDGVTMWGVTPSDFTTTVLDGQGAVGYTGVTIIFSAAGKPAAAVTLAGYTSADLLNGRLDVSYGATSAVGGLPGANYMHIQGG